MQRILGAHAVRKGVSGLICLGLSVACSSDPKAPSAAAGSGGVVAGAGTGSSGHAGTMSGGAAAVGGGGRSAGGSSAQAGAAGQAKPAGSGGGGAAANGGGGDGTLVNPAPGSKFFMGANFWNVSWEGANDFFASNVNWATTTNPWNPQFLMDVAPYHVLRFMDWNMINDANGTPSASADWSARKQPTDKQDEQVAYEWQIDLCNRSKTDYWVNVPQKANVMFFTQLATLIHDKLDPSLRVYVEWSNEVWNGGFGQAQYARTQGQQLSLSGNDKGMSYQVYQSVRVFEAFDAVFGAGSPRVVKVLAGQAASTGPCTAQMAALKDSKINPMNTQPTVYAVAPYFRGGSVADLMSKGIPEATGWVNDSYKCASAAGLPLIAYEGGQDSYTDAGDQGCGKIQKDAGMHDVYTKFLDAMVGAKLSGPFTQYTHSGNCWGLKQKTSDSAANSPKYQGVLDWLSAHP